MMRASVLRAISEAKLRDAGIGLPGLEADRIIGAVLAVSRASLHAHPEREATPESESLAADFTSRRAAGEPLASILGDAFFCGMRFFVDSHVLIPRPETEMLTELAAELLRDGAIFADWCTGSGCIAVALAARNAEARAYAADISGAVLDVARRNAVLHGVADRISFIECASPREAAGEIAPESLDLIVTNPPYIPTEIINTLETQVKDHEPRAALDGGGDGLDVCRALLADLPRFMKPGSRLIAETGGGSQAEELSALAEHMSPELALEKIFPDHRGIERFLLWRKRI